MRHEAMISGFALRHEFLSCVIFSDELCAVDYAENGIKEAINVHRRRSTMK